MQRGQRHADIDVCAREQQVRAVDGGGGVRGHGGARKANGVEAVAERRLNDEAILGECRWWAHTQWE